MLPEGLASGRESESMIAHVTGMSRGASSCPATGGALSDSPAWDPTTSAAGWPGAEVGGRAGDGERPDAGAGCGGGSGPECSISTVATSGGGYMGSGGGVGGGDVGGGGAGGVAGAGGGDGGAGGRARCRAPGPINPSRWDVMEKGGGLPTGTGTPFGALGSIGPCPAPAPAAGDGGGDGVGDGGGGGAPRCSDRGGGRAGREGGGGGDDDAIPPPVAPHADPTVAGSPRPRAWKPVCRHSSPGPGDATKGPRGPVGVADPPPSLGVRFSWARKSSPTATSKMKQSDMRRASQR